MADCSLILLSSLLFTNSDDTTCHHLEHLNYAKVSNATKAIAPSLYSSLLLLTITFYFLLLHLLTSFDQFRMPVSIGRSHRSSHTTSRLCDSAQLKKILRSRKGCPPSLWSIGIFGARADVASRPTLLVVALCSCWGIQTHDRHSHLFHWYDLP